MDDCHNCFNFLSAHKCHNRSFLKENKFTDPRTITISAHQQLTINTSVTTLGTNVLISSSTSVFSAHQYHIIFSLKKYIS